MLQRRTTFILGAGASVDMGFPLGDTLKGQIVDLLALKLLDGYQLFADRAFQTALSAHLGGNYAFRTDGFSVYLQAAEHIRDGLPFARSIDTFIDGLRHIPGVEFVSKLAIATLILRRERVSPLYPDHPTYSNAEQLAEERLGKLVGGWHAQLTQMLFDGHDQGSIQRVFANASFVVFNYDRCLEEYLVVALQRRFAIDPSAALALLKTCRIIHPYGRVGGYFPDEPNFQPFGGGDVETFSKVADELRTFTESMAEGVADAVKNALASCDRAVFLGFGWLPQNMELLNIGGRSASTEQVFATAFNMPDGEVRVVEQKINMLLRKESTFPRVPAQATVDFIYDTGDCRSLMQNCWLRLSS